MAVEERYQGKGIGKKILELLEKNAKKNNAKKIILNARDHVLSFYKSSDYTAIGKYDGSDTGIPHTSMRNASIRSIIFANCSIVRRFIKTQYVISSI